MMHGFCGASADGAVFVDESIDGCSADESPNDGDNGIIGLPGVGLTGVVGGTGRTGTSGFVGIVGTTGIYVPSPHPAKPEVVPPPPPPWV